MIRELYAKLIIYKTAHYSDREAMRSIFSKFEFPFEIFTLDKKLYHWL